MNVPNRFPRRKRVPCNSLKRVQHSSGSTDETPPVPEELAGRELRRLRIARGWSQEEVAQRMSAYGYDWHQTTVGRIEAAQRPLRLNEAADMCRLFGVALERLMWPDPDLAPEEIDAAITDVKRRYAASQQEWVAARNHEDKTRERLQNLMEERKVAEATMSTLRAELDALTKRRGSSA